MAISSKAELDIAILELEGKKASQEEELIAQFHAARESLDPVNIIKRKFNDFIESPGIHEDLAKTAAGIVAGLVSKKLLIGKSSSMFRKILGTAAEFAVTRSAISNTDKMKAYGIALYNNLFKKKHSEEEPVN